MNSDNTNRVFNRKEVSKILSKATEIQARNDLYGNQDGLNEEELVLLAKEVGIDKNALLEALQTYDLPTVESNYSWVRGTHKTQEIATVQGEITDDDWESVVSEIRRVTGGIGKVNKIGNTFEWEQRRRDIGYKHISLTPQNGKTKVQYVSGWRGLKFIVNMFTFMTFFAGVAIGLEETNMLPILNLSLALLGGLGGLSIARIFLKSYFTKQQQQAKSLVSAISTTLKKISQPTIAIEEAEQRETTPTTSSNRERV